jgi:GT2 family glycosyltransferase
MAKRPLVSIITAMWNNKPFNLQMVEFVFKNTEWPYELVLIDNGSTDGTADAIAALPYDVNGTLLKNPENRGFGLANNQGAKVAHGEYLCLLNNDTIPTKGWLTEMMNVMLSNSKIGIVGARLVHPGRGTLQHAGVYEHDSGTPDHLYFNKPMDYPDAMVQKEVFAVTGACLLIAKDLFWRVGGFDEAFRNGFEDMDLTKKVRKLDYKVIYVPSALVYHYESRTPGRYDYDNQNWNTYMQRWVLKNGPSYQKPSTNIH